MASSLTAVQKSYCASALFPAACEALDCDEIHWNDEEDHFPIKNEWIKPQGRLHVNTIYASILIVDDQPLMKINVLFLKFFRMSQVSGYNEDFSCDWLACRVPENFAAAIEIRERVLEAFDLVLRVAPLSSLIFAYSGFDHPEFLESVIKLFGKHFEMADKSKLPTVEELGDWADLSLPKQRASASTVLSILGKKRPLSPSSSPSAPKRRKIPPASASSSQ